MRSRVLCVAGTLLMALGAVPAMAQDSSQVLIPRSIAQSHGLNRAWMTHVEINPGQDRVQSVVYWTAEPKAAKKAAAPMGEPEILGNKEPMTVEDLLPKPPPPPPVVPIEEKSTLYVLSKRGVLHSLDSETGRTFWVTQVGSREKPNEPPAVNKLYVAVVNGGTLYVLDRRDGGVVFRKELSSVASAGPAIGDEWVYVPMLSGHLVAYKLPDVRLGAADAPAAAAPAAQPKAAPGAKAKDTGDRNRKLRDKQRQEYDAGQIEFMTYASFAPIIVPPLVTPHRLAWSTSRGQLFLAFNDRVQIDNRFDMLKPVDAPLTYWPPYVYAASKDGYVYGVHEQKSDAPWRYSIGEPLYQPAVAVEGMVYAAGKNSGMFCLDAQTGERLWWAPGIRSFLACSANRIYTADNTGALQVLDRKSGAQVDSLRIDRLDLRVVNGRSDRIYLGTAGGVLQCLHEIGQDTPLLHVPDPAPGPKVAEKAKEPVAPEQPNGAPAAIP
jgi:outer membrane protein assembly factor BamB